MTDVPLEAFLRRMWRTVEKAFEHDGEIPMAWLLERADGKQIIVITPVAESSSYKDAIANEMRKFMREQGVVRYAVATEVWERSEDPERREGVIIIANDGQECLTSMRYIVRAQHGRPFLGKLEATDYGAVGRFNNLLDTTEVTPPSRPSVLQ
jgi:hypothetical protein